MGKIMNKKQLIGKIEAYTYNSSMRLDSKYQLLLNEVKHIISQKIFEYVGINSTLSKNMGNCQLLLLDNKVYFKDSFYKLSDDDKILAILLEYYYYMNRSYLGKLDTLTDKEIDHMKEIVYMYFKVKLKDINKYVQTNKFKCKKYREQFICGDLLLDNKIEDERIIEADVYYRILVITKRGIENKCVLKHFIYDKQTCEFIRSNSKLRKELLKNSINK